MHSQKEAHMHSSNALLVWDERWGAYQSILTQLNSGVPTPTFKTLANCLQAFGESQFKFFCEGFREGHLWPSAQYPAENVLSTTLNQVGYDIAVIQRASKQRGSKDKKMLDTLHKTDQLAQLALNLAIDGKLLPQSTVISYFNKSAYIRTIPYAPLALVAVPYTATAVPRDYLATPHEIGHHIYRHSPSLMADLRDRLPLQPAWCSRWQEEIFADVYGCLVAGPVVGLDFQDIVFDHSLANFMSDDGEHPVEAIRPFAYVKVLAKLGFPNAAKALKQEWKRKLAARNNPESFVPYGEFNSVNLEEARKKLEAFALQILAYLQDEREIQPKTYWSQDLAEGEVLDSLYQKFAAWIKQPLNVTVPELKEEGNEVGVMVKGQLVNKRHKGNTQTWIDTFKQQKGSQLPPEAWTPIISSDGWNVAGPNTDWPP
jgi:hypothetical protein